MSHQYVSTVIVPAPAAEPVNRITEHVEKPSEKPSLIQGLYDRLYADLPLIAERVSGKDQIVDAAVRSLRTVQAYCADVGTLLKAAVRAGVEVRTDKPAEREKLADLMVKKVTLPKIAVTAPELIDFNTLALSRPEMYALLDKRVQGLTRLAVLSTKAAFEQMVNLKIFGMVERHPDNPEVGRFDFTRAVVMEGLAATRQSKAAQSSNSDVKRILGFIETVQSTVTTTTTERDIARTFRQAEHTHLVFDIQERPWPASGVVMPAFASRLLKEAPAFFRPDLTVLEAKMAREQIVEKDTGYETRTEVSQSSATTRKVVARKLDPDGVIVQGGKALRNLAAGVGAAVSSLTALGVQHDPVVTLGGTLILCGWSDRDL